MDRPLARVKEMVARLARGRFRRRLAAAAKDWRVEEGSLWGPTELERDRNSGSAPFPRVFLTRQHISSGAGLLNSRLKRKKSIER
jgi:hypothetical protein